MSDPELSIVLPCFEERDAVAPLAAELYAVLRGGARSFEILFVDDASRDGTDEVLQRLAAKYPELHVIHHSVNCGESAAQATGFRCARGEIVVTMDSDGQNDPADIPRLLAALESGAGCDCVCGVRRRREDDWVRRLSSRIGNGFRRWITGDDVTDAGCTYRAIRRAALAEIPVFNGMHRFLPTLLRAQGFTATELEVNDRPRTTGRSKYGIGNRMWRGLLDCFAIRWYQRRAVPGQRLTADAARTASAVSSVVGGRRG